MAATLELFKQKINILIHNYLEDKIASFKANCTDDLIKESMDQALLLSGGGKRSRAYLLALTADDLDLEKEKVIKACLAVEVFHTFALIHDDINDSAATRRGEATIHSFVEVKSGNAKLGLDYGILIGDLFLNWSNQLISGVGSSLLSEAFHKMVDTTVLGQIKDITLRGNQRAEYAEIRQKDIEKTAYYTFVHPMIMGNILSGGDVMPELLEGLGTSLGIGYQIQDDLIDVVSEKSGKSRFGDMKEGQPTQMYCYALENSSSEDQATLRGLLGETDIQSHEGSLMQIFADSGALKWANMLVKENYDASRQLIEKNTESLGQMQSEKLIDLIAYLESRMV